MIIDLTELTQDRANYERQRQQLAMQVAALQKQLEQAIADANAAAGIVLYLDNKIARAQQPTPEPTNGKEPETDAKKLEEESNG